MQILKYCNLNFLIKLSVGLVVFSLLVFVSENVDLQFLRGTIEIQAGADQDQLSSEQMQQLRQQVLNKQFNIE